jgi:hypothetical protein
MSLTYVAQLSLPALCPTVQASIGIPSANLSGQLTGNLAINAAIQASPPTLAAVLSASLQQTTALELALASIPPVPDFSFQLSDVVSLQASLSAALSVQLPALNALLSAAAGIYAFGWEGTGSSLGAAITTELATQWPDGNPTSGTCTALIFGAVVQSPFPDPQPGLRSFLGGIPFASGLVYGGKLGISTLSPITAGAAVQGSASIGASISAAAKLSIPPVPATFVSMLAAQAKFYSNVSALGAIASPSVTLAVTAAAVASLQANFGASCSLGAVLASGATLFVYSYTGAANALGAALTSALSSSWGSGTPSVPTSSTCTAAVLGATDALSISTLLEFFGGA